MPQAPTDPPEATNSRPSGRGRSHGTSTKEPFDRWFRYPAGFASDYVELLLDRLNLDDGQVVDCFAGSGVTGTAARARGFTFAGIEAHPLVAEIADLKLNLRCSASELRTATSALQKAAAKERVKTAAKLAAEPDLLRRSFSSSTLSDLLVLRDLVQEREGQKEFGYLKWALLSTLRDVAEVKVGWPYQRPGQARRPKHKAPFERFAERAAWMAADIEELDTDSREGFSAEIVIGDSRDPASWAKLSGEAVACVASPPYLNNFDYADATRLELYFWGEVSTWSEMCRDIRGEMLTASTQQSSKGEMRDALETLDERAGLQEATPGVVREIAEIVQQIVRTKAARERRSKEYDQVVPAYFLAMWDILENLHNHLAPGGSALWLVGDSAPYGVYVDTPRLIAELSQLVGFVYKEDLNLRERGNRWGSNADRHKVKLAERLIVLERPGHS